MIQYIHSLDDPCVGVYSRLTETQLRNRLDPENGIFIAESPKVINVALDAGYKPLSILCEEKHIKGDAAELIKRCQGISYNQDFPIYTGSRELLSSLTGFTLTRGVLCAMHRPQPVSVETVLQNSHRIVVIDGVVDATNIGAIFRSAAALGIDAVLLTPNSCDPLNRRAIRVSMGCVFLVPWTFLEDENVTESLHRFGFQTAAMALTDCSISLADPILKTIPRLAIIMGTEGDGLPLKTIGDADFVVRIPMFHNVDSLNVAAAAAVTFWELRSR